MDIPEYCSFFPRLSDTLCFCLYLCFTLLYCALLRSQTQIRKFRERELEGPDLFEDLPEGEFFPPDLVTVSRILEIDDDDVDVCTIDYANALFPTDTSFSTSITATVSSDAIVKEADDGWEGVDSISRSNTTNKRHERKNRKDTTPEPKPTSQRNLRLHGSSCWLVVKWEGLSYSDASFEDVRDLRGYRHRRDLVENRHVAEGAAAAAAKAKATAATATSAEEKEGESEGRECVEGEAVEYLGIEYEQALRDFYRREQRTPSKIHTLGQKRYNRSLNTTALSASAPAAFHSDNGFRLRDYQWDGVRWILFNWSQKRNCILADEMGLGKYCVRAEVFYVYLYGSTCAVRVYVCTC